MAAIRKKCSFTFIELLIALSLCISICALLGISLFQKLPRYRFDKSIQQVKEQIQQAINLTKITNNRVELQLIQDKDTVRMKLDVGNIYSSFAHKYMTKEIVLNGVQKVWTAANQQNIFLTFYLNEPPEDMTIYFQDAQGELETLYLQNYIQPYYEHIIQASQETITNIIQDKVFLSSS